MKRKSLIYFGIAVLGLGIVNTFPIDNVQAKSSHTYVTKVKKHKIYNVKIKSVSENDLGDWVVKGTSKAPDGTKIVATPTKKKAFQSGYTISQSKKGGSYAKVRNHKFSAKIQSGGVNNNKSEEQPGKQAKVLIFGISNYKRKFNNDHISKALVKKVQSKITPKKFGYTQKLVTANKKYGWGYYSDAVNDVTGNSNSNASSSTSKNTEDQDELLAKKLPKNVLHGYRDKSDSKKNNMGGWVIKGRDYVRFWTNGKGIITSMKLDFRDVPLMADDPDNDEYITDNTAEDAVKTSDLGDNKYLYHSAKYNLSYQVDFQKNDDGDITLISIFPEQ